MFEKHELKLFTYRFVFLTSCFFLCSIYTDVAFGVAGGFKTCLILSSNMPKLDLETAKRTKELIPDYVTESVENLYEKIKYL